MVEYVMGTVKEYKTIVRKSRAIRPSAYINDTLARMEPVVAIRAPK